VADRDHGKTRYPRGGSSLWTTGLVGEILRAEFFGADAVVHELAADATAQATATAGLGICKELGAYAA